MLVEEDCRQFGHALTERLRGLDFEMLAIGEYLALKLRVYHQIERNHTAFFAPALNVLQRMYRQGAQVILRPSVALDHDMLHLLAVGMGHAHDIAVVAGTEILGYDGCYTPGASLSPRLREDEICGDWNYLLSLQHKCCETAHARQSILTSLPSLNRSFDSHKQRVLWKKDYSKERFTLNC